MGPFDCMTECLILGLIVILTLIFFLHQWSFNYWQSRNVPTLPTKYVIGNIENPFTVSESLGFQFKNFYEEFKKRGVTKFGGVYLFTTPFFVALDLELIKNIMTRDYNHFESRGVYTTEKQVISEHLFSLEGERWKNLRVKLTPTFTSGKMKQMFETLINSTLSMVSAVDAEAAKPGGINIKRVCVCYTTDVIGSCAFGIECNSFKNETTDFIKYGRLAVTQTGFEAMKRTFQNSFPNLSRKLGLVPFDTSINTFFTELVESVVTYRETNNVRRNDFIQLLIDMKNGKNTNEETVGGNINMDVITAQSFIFFFAGFETSSSTMTYALLELSQNQEIQQRARDEIVKVLKKYDGKITYEAMMDMKYLTQVVEETLRLYPIVPLLVRKCTKRYQVPNEDLVIEKDTNVGIPIIGIQRDEQYYPNPMKFDPERFTDENKNGRHKYTYLPFGEGPRVCIGLRFGMLQVKVGLAYLLSNYKFTLNEKTQMPLKYNTSLLLAVAGDVWLNTEKIVN